MKKLVVALSAVIVLLLVVLFALVFGRSRSASAYALSGESSARMPSDAYKEEPAPAAEADERPMKQLEKMRTGTVQVMRSAEKKGLNMPSAPAALGLMGSGPGGGGVGDLGGIGAKPKRNAKDSAADTDGELENSASVEEPAATRAWFPETFLFQPLVVTDANGEAVVPVKVPDRLTSWRVLALAHTRDGSQAGATTSFLGTLPAYVDPIVPSFLMSGDAVKLPVQLVNTTGAELTRTVSVEASGAELKFASLKVAIPAQASKVEFASLATKRPGMVGLRASMGSSDAVERSFPVLPTGRPVELKKGGTLAAPRTQTLEAPADAEAESAKVKLVVYPGALALLRSELAGSLARGGVAEDAYTLLLAGRATGLLGALGEKADPDAVRRMTLVSGQRAVRHGRSPSTDAAALLAEAALAHPENPVLSRLGERLSQQVARAQRPDGTFEGGGGWTLQRLLVTTASCLTAVRADETSPQAKQRAQAALLKARLAFERHVERVPDAYTAAAILASGAVEGALADKLRDRVREAVKQNEDGSRYLPVPEQVVRPDGATPSYLEATALAALALEGDSKAPWRADLGATLLGRYEPGYGWGDGFTNLVALRAVLALFKEPLPPSVKVSLEMDGKVLLTGTLDTAKTRDVLALEGPAPEAKGSHSWTVRAEPAVPGLGFALNLTTWVPWKKEAVSDGMELEIVSPKEPRVGEAATVELTAATPANRALTLRQSLPAGVQAETKSLDALVEQGLITRYRTEDGAVVLDLPPRPSTGATFHASYKVVPTLAGTLRSSASSLAYADAPERVHHVPPAVWEIRE